jgi:Hyaluronidase
MKALSSYLIVASIISLFLFREVMGAGANFVVFDGTIYKNKPDLSSYGIKPIYLINANTLWKKGQNINNLPDVGLVRQAARTARSNGRIAIIDIEHWKLRGEETIVNESVTKYATVLQWFHDAAPEVLVGYYGLPPIRDYWRAINGPDAPQYIAWQAENDRLKPIIDKVNILFPSLYTYYADKDGWIKHAIANIKEARRYLGNKPVYVFLWPQYHESNSSLALKYLPPNYWKMELEIARQYADGAIIWAGWDFNKKARAQWNDDAPWWQVTKRFVEEVRHR